MLGKMGTDHCMPASPSDEKYVDRQGDNKNCGNAQPEETVARFTVQYTGNHRRRRRESPLFPGLIARVHLVMFFRKEDDNNRWKDALRLAGIPDELRLCWALVSHDSWRAWVIVTF
jgi:hypothetical protein